MKYALLICTPVGGEELSPEDIAGDPASPRTSRRSGAAT